MTPSEQHQAGAETASELLARRAQLQEWLHRLDRVDDDVPVQVKRRVRSDYERRLAEVVAELSAHSEALSADRERLDETLLAAAERHDSATDALEEARLRHLIGELSEEDWESRRPELEAEVEAARADRETTEREIRALDELLGQLGAASPAAEPESPAIDVAELGSSDEDTVEAPRPTAPAEPTAEDFAGEAEEWVPDLPEIEPPADWRQAPVADAGEPVVEQPSAEEHAPPASTEDELPIMGDPMDVSSYPSEEDAPADDDLVEITTFAAAAEALADEVDSAPADDDYAFLEELDRAIAATSPGGSSGSSSGDQEGTSDEEQSNTRPQPGLKCPDCGYSNDPAAWYCGVCGVDLG